MVKVSIPDTADKARDDLEFVAAMIKSGEGAGLYCHDHVGRGILAAVYAGYLLGKYGNLDKLRS